MHTDSTDTAQLDKSSGESYLSLLLNLPYNMAGIMLGGLLTIVVVVV